MYKHGSGISLHMGYLSHNHRKGIAKNISHEAPPPIDRPDIVCIDIICLL